jgi:hypothetical protein
VQNLKKGSDATASQTCNLLVRGVLEDVNLNCGRNVYYTCFARRAMGCRKISKANGTKTTLKGIPSTCTCHCVPDAVPIAFCMENIKDEWQTILRDQGLVIVINKAILSTLPNDHPMHMDMEWVMNPILALCALRFYLQRSVGCLKTETLRCDVHSIHWCSIFFCYPIPLYRSYFKQHIKSNSCFFA